MLESKSSLMPFEGRNVPHVVIEVNQKCNISCAACYKDKYNYTKPFDQIRQEIDVAVSSRNLNTITLAGGEPTLHPELERVISYIKSKRIDVRMLSNGYSLNAESLLRYRAAGLSEIYLHIDSMQKRGDVQGEKSEKALNGLRASIGRLIVRAGVTCSAEITLYKKNLNELPDVVDFVFRNTDFTRLLVTCYTDFGAIGRTFKKTEILGVPYTRKNNDLREDFSGKIEPSKEVVSVAEVKQVLQQKYGLVPFGHVGSNVDHSEQRWILYYTFVIEMANGRHEFLHLGEKFSRLVRLRNALAKWMGKPYSFGNEMSTQACVAACAFYAFIALDSRIMLQGFKFLAKLFRPGARIFVKSLIFQQGPNVNEQGEIEYCKDCPDATVRNGKLVPVCMADILDTLPPDLLNSRGFDA